MNVMENPLVADLLDEFIHAEDNGFQTVSARIPALFGISEKASYLAFRSLGLSTRESLNMLGLDEEYLGYWANTDPEFLEWEAKHIITLQNSLSVDLIRLGFTRNAALFIAKDASIIRRSLTEEGMATLSKREYDYLMKVRGHYTPADFLALEKALEPEKHRENVVIHLSWGSGMQVLEGVEVPYTIGESNGNEEHSPKRVSLPDPQEVY